MSPTWRHALRRWRGRHPMGMFGEILFDAPIRNVQFGLGLFTVLLGANLLLVEPLTSIQVNRAVYWWIAPAVVGWVRLLVGAGQIGLALSGARHWRWRFAVAQMQVLLATYVYTANVLVTGELASSTGQLWLIITESWIAGRILLDQNLNGDDRRGRSYGGN